LQTDSMHNHYLEYVHLASLVGKILLVLSGDPILEQTRRFLHRNTEELPCPAEFLVASYIHPHVDTNGVPVQTIHSHGFFYVLPLTCDKTVQSCIQCTNVAVPLTSQGVWTMGDDQLSQLPGICILTPSDVIRHLEQTDAIYEGIAKEVSRLAEQNPAISSRPISIVQYETEDADSKKSSVSAVTSSLNGLSHLQDAVGADIVRSITKSHHPMKQVMNSCMNRTKQAENLAATNEVILCSNHKETFVSIPDVTIGNACSMVYTDICFETKEDRNKFDQSQKISVLCFVEGEHYTVKTHLENESMQDSWGMEILQWASDKHFRIGRILPESRAAKSGISPGDILKSINGKHPSVLFPATRFASLMLGKSSPDDPRIFPFEAAAWVMKQSSNGNEPKTSVVLPELVLVKTSSSPSTAHHEENGTNIQKQEKIALMTNAIIQENPSKITDSNSPLQHTNVQQTNLANIGNGLHASEMLQIVRGRKFRSDDVDVLGFVNKIKQKPFGRQTQLDVNDLYFPGVNGTCTTLLETSLLLVRLLNCVCND
jgi:hypothetical protein